MINPKSVILFNNGMVAVFDDSGEQMPKYQGRHAAAAAALKGADLSDCTFERENVQWQCLETLTQEQFFNLSSQASNGAH